MGFDYEDRAWSPSGELTGTVTICVTETDFTHSEPGTWSFSLFGPSDTESFESSHFRIPLPDRFAHLYPTRTGFFRVALRLVQEPEASRWDLVDVLAGPEDLCGRAGAWRIAITCWAFDYWGGADPALDWIARAAEPEGVLCSRGFRDATARLMNTELGLDYAAELIADLLERGWLADNDGELRVATPPRRPDEYDDAPPMEFKLTFPPGLDPAEN